MADQIASLFVKIGADIDDWTRGLNQVKSDASGLEKAFGGLQDVVGTGLKLAAGVGVAAVGGLAAGMVKAVNEAGNLEQQAANIAATFTDAAPPIDEVKAAINSLALDPSLVVGVEDAGAGIKMLAQNGLSWQQIADGAARSSILLANATGADLATSADITTNALGIFGLQVEDLDSVVATFTNAANKSQFGVEDWGYALANAGPKAAAMGFKMEDLFAAMTLTSSGFASGMTEGTSWAWMINGLVPNTLKAEGAMKELGLITADGANQFFNADGTGKGLTEVLQLLQGAFGGLTQEQQMAYSRTIFGQEAFGALSGVLGMNISDLNALIPQMTDFAAVEAGAETRTNTFQAAMGQFNDTINSVFAMIGDKFLPVVTKMARAFTAFISENAAPLIEWAGQAASAFADFFDTLLDGGTILDAFAILLGDLLPDDLLFAWIDINDAIASFVQGVMAFFAPLADAITQFVKWQDVLTVVGGVILTIVVPAIWGFIAAATPVIALFAALVAAASLLRHAWESDFGGIQEKTRIVFDYIGGVFGPLLNTIREFGGEALGEIVKWATGQETEFTATQIIWEAAKDAFGKAFADIGTALKNFGDRAWSEFSERFPKAADAFSSAWNTLKEGFLKGKDAITSGLQYLGEKFTPLGDTIKAFGRQALQEIVDWATGNETNFTATQKIWETAKETFSTVFTDIGTKLAEWGQIAWDWFKERFPNAADALVTAVDSIKQNFQEFWDAVKPLIDKVVKAFNGLVEDWTSGSGDMSGALATAQAIMDGVWTIMVTVASTSINTMINVLTLVAQLLTGDWSGAWQTAQQIVSDVLNAVDTIVGTVLTTVGGMFGINKESIQQWYSATKENISAWWGHFSTQIANRDWAGIGADILKAFDRTGIKQWYDETTQKIRDWWETFKKYIVDQDWFKYGKDIIDGLLGGIQSAWHTFSTWTSTTFQGWIDWFDRLFEFGSPSKLMAQRGQWLMQGLQGGIDSSAPGVLGAVNSLAGQVQGRVDGMVNSIQSSVAAINNSLNSISMPTIPGMPTTPTLPTTPTTGANSGYVPQAIAEKNAAIAYGGYKLGVGVNQVQGLTDVAGFATEFMTFVDKIGGMVDLYNLAPSGTAQGQALQILQSGSVFDQKVDDVLSAIQTLLRLLAEKGLGNQFFVQTPPDENKVAKYELIELVQYLNALYGT